MLIPLLPIITSVSYRPSHAHPAPSQAWCDFRDGYAITELPILNKDFMQAATGDHLMDYGADNTALRALLNISYFCSQETQYG